MRVKGQDCNHCVCFPTELSLLGLLLLCYTVANPLPCSDIIQRRQRREEDKRPTAHLHHLVLQPSTWVQQAYVPVSKGPRVCCCFLFLQHSLAIPIRLCYSPLGATGKCFAVAHLITGVTSTQLSVAHYFLSLPAPTPIHLFLV